MASIDIHLTPGGPMQQQQPLPPTPSADAGVGAVDEATALMFAAERGAIKSIQSWQQRGGNLDTLVVHQAGGSYTPLQLAAFTGHAIAVRTLLAAGMDPTATAASVAARLGGGLAPGGQPASAGAAVGHLPLHLCARYGHAGALEALLEAGVDPNTADEFGQTALHYAAAYGHLPACAALARAGADVYATEVGGRTADQLAAAAGQGGTSGYLRRLAEAGSSRDGSSTAQLVAMLQQQQQQQQQQQAAAAGGAMAASAAFRMPGSPASPASATAAFPGSASLGGAAAAAPYLADPSLPFSTLPPASAAAAVSGFPDMGGGGLGLGATTTAAMGAYLDAPQQQQQQFYAAPSPGGYPAYATGALPGGAGDYGSSSFLPPPPPGAFHGGASQGWGGGGGGPGPWPAPWAWGTLRRQQQRRRQGAPWWQPLPAPLQLLRSCALRPPPCPPPASACATGSPPLACQSSFQPS